MIDTALIQQALQQAVNDSIAKTVDELRTNPEWQAQIERLITQTVIQRTSDTLSNIDIAWLVHERVDQNMKVLREGLLTNFSSTGIDDRASACQLTIMDDSIVIENQITAPEVNVLGTTVTQNLVVKGAINTDNQSWKDLANNIAQDTLDALNEQWRDQLIADVAEKIRFNGIEFDEIRVNGEPLITENRLASTVTETNIQKLGTVRELTVKGQSKFNNDTLNVLNRRIGINTEEPEMALSVWDEEVSIIAGKFKKDQAFIGTSRNSGLAIGTNRQPHIEIDNTGETRIHKLRVAQWQIGHSREVPGWSGTRGDIIFNANPGVDNVFAWMCLGGYKWQVLKSAQ